MSSHYSQVFTPEFTSKCLEAAKSVAETLEHYGKGYPVLCYTGFSGIATATVLASLLRNLGLHVEQIYVRKTGEKSHGSQQEFSNRNLGEHAIPIFVDDFVDSGKTHEHVRQGVIELFNETARHFEKYLPWSGFYHLLDLKVVDSWDDACWREQMMPHVLIGHEVEVDLRPELWEDDVPFHENYSMALDTA